MGNPAGSPGMSFCAVFLSWWIFFEIEVDMEQKVEHVEQDEHAREQNAGRRRASSFQAFAAHADEQRLERLRFLTFIML